MASTALLPDLNGLPAPAPPQQPDLNGQEAPAPLPSDNSPGPQPDLNGQEAPAPDAGQLRKFIDSDPYFPITPATAKIIYDEDQSKGFLGRAGETLDAIPSGLSALANQIGAAHEQMSNVPFPTSRNEVERLSNTITEAGAEGALNTWGLAKRAGFNFWDFLKEKATGASDGEKIANYVKELQLKQSAERSMRGLPDTRPDNFDPSAPSFVLKGYGDAPPYDKAAQVLSMPLDPTFMVGAGALGPLAKLATKIPGVARAAELAGAAASKALPTAAGALETAGRVTKDLAKAPQEAIGNALNGILPKGVTSALGSGAAVAHVAGHGGPLSAPIAILKGAEAGGKAVEQTAGFFRRLGETSGDEIRSRLLQMAQDPTTPAWMKVAAGKLDALKVGDAAQYIGELAKGSAEGGATGAALATAAGSSPEERGQMIGTGLGLGAVGAGTRILSGADAAARRVLADVGAKQRFLERVTKPVEAGGSGLSLDEAKGVDDTTATVAGHAADLLGDAVNWRVLRPGEAVPGGEPGAAASYDPIGHDGKPTINFRMGDNTGRALHEIGHAVDQAAGAPGEARLQIDSIFTPDQLRDFGAQYAARLAGSKDPAAVLAKMQQLDQSFKGDQWIYNEVYAEAGYGTLKGAQAKFGPSFMQSLLGANRSIWGQLAAAARSTFLNHIMPDAFAQDGAPTLPRGAIFNDPAIYGNPGLRKMFVQHLNEIRQSGVAAIQAKDAGSVAMPERLFGKHPKAPAQMLMENGLTLQDRNGNLRRANPAEARKMDRAKAKQIGDLLAQEPVRPKGDTTPEVAPRLNSDGKTEVSGTKITDLLNKLPGYGPFARGVAAAAETLIGTGKAFKAGYFAVGTSEGGDWRKSVARNSGDLPWQEIHLAPFEFRIDSKGHALVTGLSVTAADRKIARWAQEGQLDKFWNGDTEAFKRDLHTYLENHKDNRPGADKIGDHKRDMLNLFVAGKLNPKDVNPLRAAASSQDRNGIIRSLRLDRISSMEDSDHTGWHAEYPKKKINFSPEADTEKEQLIRDRIAAGMTPRDLTYTVNKDPNFPGWGFVQVDDPRDNNAFSSNPDQLARLGMDMPGTTKDLLDRLPSGRFSLDQVVSHLSGKEKSPVLFSPPVDKEDKTGVWYSRLETAIRSLPAGDTKPKTGQQWKGWIARMSQGEAIPTQGKGTYRGGIAQEEIKWSGLEDALKDGGKYTKAQVLDLLAKNAVQVQDVVSKPGVTVPDFENAWHDEQDMGEGKVYHSWQDGDYEIATIVDEGEDPQKTDEYVISFTDPATDRGQGGRDINKAFSWKDAIREAQDHAEQHNRDNGGGKYSDYRAMPGGENYRELRLTLPDNFDDRAVQNLENQIKEEQIRLDQEIDQYNAASGDQDDETGFSSEYFNDSRRDIAELKNKLRLLEREREGSVFESQHWDEPNVLAHVRFDERKGPKGEKILFLHELQSDWHQQGRERGYRTPSPENENSMVREKHLARLAEIAKEIDDKFVSKEPHKFGTPEEQVEATEDFRRKRETMLATAGASPHYDRVLREFKEAEARMRYIVPGWGVAPGAKMAGYADIRDMRDLASILERNVDMGILPEGAKPLSEEARRIADELKIIDEERSKRKSRVPDAPYKHSWPELAMRRMIKWAADHGFAKIAWTTGKQQNELYNLRKHVRGISYKDNGDQTYNVSAMLPNGAGHMLGERMTQAQVADYIGRELAAKIAAGDGKEVNYAANNEPENIRKELRGLDLEVGGEGMKGFYDRILPITAAKLARRYGGAVGTMKIRHPGDTAFDLQGQNSRGEASRIRGFDNRAAAEAEFARLRDKPGGDSLEIIENPGETVHALALTPEGLQDVQQKGMPLFSPVMEAGASSKETAQRARELWKEKGVASPFFRRWFGGSKVVDDKGAPKTVYRGDFRGDEVNGSFKKGVQTSGRFFFTEDPAIASNYATGKHWQKETSFDEMFTFPGLRRPGERRDPNLSQVWYRLTPEQQAKVREVVLTTGKNDDGDLVFGKEDGSIMGRQGIDWEVQQARGNWLAAARSIWLESGAIFNDEAQFSEIMKAAGLDARYTNPQEPRSAVTPVYLSIQNPLRASNVTPEVISELGKRVSRSRAKAKSGDGRDLWDKETRTPQEWMQVLEEEHKKHGNDLSSSYVFTSVPEKITKALQAMGYDGIEDRGGKMGGPGHGVWVAFEPEQIKSIFNKGMFDPKSQKISYSPDVKGEYWITDNGVDFADGDVGDTNHEMHAVRHAAQHILDLFAADSDEEFYDENMFRDAIIKSLNEDDEEGKADKHNWEKLAENYLKAHVPADKLDQTLEEFETARGQGDARDTAVKHWGWVWVRGNHASTWTLTKDDMKNIADGYSEIAEQEGLEELEGYEGLENMEISIHVGSTGRRVTMTLGELESGRTPSVDPTWPGQIPPSFSPDVSGDEDRTFYRGTEPGKTDRIPELFPSAKGLTFAARKPDSAGVYGSSVEKITAKPDAKILYSESPEFWKLLGRRRPGNDYIGSALRRGETTITAIDAAIAAAKKAGYDAVSFKQDSDIGTVILNEGAFTRNK